jgi:hypothetical protein
VLALAAAPRELWTQQLLVLYPAMSALSILIQAWGISSADGKLPGSLSLGSWVPKASCTVRDGLEEPVSCVCNMSLPRSTLYAPSAQNFTSWVYTLFALVYLGTAAACYAPASAPSLFIGLEGPGALLIKHTWAPGFLLSAVACLNLRDAAERNRLGA